MHELTETSNKLAKHFSDCGVCMKAIDKVLPRDLCAAGAAIYATWQSEVKQKFDDAN